MKSRYHVPKITHVILVIAIISSLLIIAGYYYYTNEENRIRQQKQNELKAVAELKIYQISEWYKDEVVDAKVISHNSTFIEKIENFKQKKEKSNLLKIIQEIKFEHGYDEILLTTHEAKILTSTYNATEIDSVITEKIYESARTNSVISSDLYSSPLQNNAVYLSFISPIFNENNNQIAIVVFFTKLINFCSLSSNIGQFQVKPQKHLL